MIELTNRQSRGIQGWSAGADYWTGQDKGVGLARLKHRVTSKLGRVGGYGAVKSVKARHKDKQRLSGWSRFDFRPGACLAAGSA